LQSFNGFRLWALSGLKIANKTEDGVEVWLLREQKDD